ncbi:hypothetical protein PR048_005804 [Dryococelus australis]|uniref:Uncharacterized protein n=1 Tax=Dryococelus australis TaxID=614101 RepID=A0ABQ9I995_9NEOP|nr:hypothetical protein PR048_005804 [Dryococelus australis]
MSLVGGFSREYPVFPTPSFRHCSTLPQSPSSALDNSILRAVQISSLTYGKVSTLIKPTNAGAVLNRAADKESLGGPRGATLGGISTAYPIEPERLEWLTFFIPPNLTSYQLLYVKETAFLEQFCAFETKKRRGCKYYIGCAATVRLLVLQHGEPGLIPGRVTPRIFANVEQCRQVGGFPGDLHFPSPLHLGAAPFSPHFTLIGSQDLVVKKRPNL